MSDTDGLLALIRSVVAPTDYHALYPATVVSQNSDFSLELKPDSPKLKSYSKVAIRYGLPGVTAKVLRGARVRIGFENGNPKSPYAALFDPDSLDELIFTAKTKITFNAPEVNLADEDGRPVARQGDTVECIVSPGVPVPLTGTVAGAPFTGVATFASSILGIIDSPDVKTKAS